MAEDAQYQSLYRKYRPQRPEEVLGQEHVVRALVGAVREGRLAHAFLFTGPRGTGKTSTARILAKMVNCEKGPTPEPCGSCEQCVRIAAGSHLDVVEIDAASHGGVDDARELRERAPTAPAQGREKVYIIDEAQRLSREAFDALLKVFEEPPAGVRFVLATTEPHKMPATIVGRCQRFDFRRGTSDVVAEHLMRIAKDEGISLAEQAAHVIARQAEGSFRDALSLLDQASVLAGESEIGEDVIESLLGSVRPEIQYELADAVAVGDTASVFGQVHGLVQEGQDLRHVTALVLQHFRNLILAQSAPGQADIVDVPADEYERLRAQAAKFRPAELSRVISLLLAAQTDMRWTTSPRLTLELALIRATLPESDPAPEALIARIERLERLARVEHAVQEPGAQPPQQAASQRSARKKEEPRTSRKPERAEPATEPPPQEPPAAAEAVTSPGGEDAVPTEDRPGGGPAVDVELIRRSWPTLIERLRASHKAVLAANLESVTATSFDGSTLELAFPRTGKFGVAKVEERESDLRSVLQELFGLSPRVRCVVREPLAGPAEELEDEPPPSAEDALARIKAEFDAEVAAEPETRS